jgi:hypothetical protein
VSTRGRHEIPGALRAERPKALSQLRSWVRAGVEFSRGARSGRLGARRSVGSRVAVGAVARSEAAQATVQRQSRLEEVVQRERVGVSAHRSAEPNYWRRGVAQSRIHLQRGPVTGTAAWPYRSGSLLWRAAQCHRFGFRMRRAI